MEPGPLVLNDFHRDFLTTQVDYVDGSGRVDAVYHGNDGDLFVLAWQTIEPRIGAATCRGVAPPRGLPQSWSCDSGGDVAPFTIDGYSHSTGHGPQELMVKHSRDAEAVLIELADGGTYVIRPDGSAVSYHVWDGSRPVRFTVFWNDGTSASEVLSP